ncbi:MAG: hypothetical protein ACN6O7_11055 [Sphingobacterium sp.]
MKKISLKNLNLNEVDQLSREQLKNVLGGYTVGTSSGITEKVTTNHNCNCSSGKYCFVSVANNPTAEQIKQACESCCNPPAVDLV